jgi:16S rRNA (cytosine967-C5)-methyltransferase
VSQSAREQDRSHAVVPTIGGPRTSREVALEVLHRVDADRAWSGVVLRRTLEQAALSPRDGALATELVYGTLRHRAEIDWALSRSSHTPLPDLPSRIRTVLRIGAYQILFLERIPPAAACWEAVELAKRVGHRGTARLVNAVMRRLADSPPVVPDDAGTAEGLALRYSHPAWLVARWVERFGLAETRALCAANNETPPSSIRLNTLRGTPESLTARLAGIGVETAPSAFLPEGRRVSAGAPDAWKAGYDAGWFSPQDEGSMLVARLVNARPGNTVIDVCAAPGGKTTHLAALMENRGRIIACDIRPAKLAAVSRQSARLGATIVEVRSLDAARLGTEYPGAADRVLVDAPCSGLGVVRRRPEIKWRLEEAILPILAARQREILGGAAGAVRPGGLLVYSVCSIEPEEGPAIAEEFLARHPEFAPSVLSELPPLVPGAPGTGFLYPHRSDLDGFFMAAFQRTA